jgi:hypothetical protein
VPGGPTRAEYGGLGVTSGGSAGEPGLTLG